MSKTFGQKHMTLAKLDPNILMADGFEDALEGYLVRFDGPPVAVYDREKCLKVLIDRDGMTEEAAEEFFEFNVSGAYVGPYTPLYI